MGTQLHVIESATPELVEWADEWFDEWFDAFDNAMAHGRHDPVRDQRAELRTSFEKPIAAYRKVVVSAVDDGRVVGGAVVNLPQLDNPALAELELAVAPLARRQGHGSALLTAVRDVAKEHGRTTLQTAIDRPPERQDWPGAHFLRHHGFRMALADIRRDLPLPVDAEVVAALQAGARAHAQGFSIEGWTGRTPDADRERMARLMARMSTDAPLGDLEYEPEVWDDARVVDYEERQEVLGRSWWTAVAVAPDGEWVGYTQMGWTPHDPTRLYQWDTLVLREQRGHRLGLLLKLDLMGRVLPQVPTATRVTTWNAASNAPMIAVNEAIGYRAVEVAEEWQGEIGALTRL